MAFLQVNCLLRLSSVGELMGHYNSADKSGVNDDDHDDAPDGFHSFLFLIFFSSSAFYLILRLVACKEKRDSCRRK